VAFGVLRGRGGSLPSVFVASKMLTVKCSCVGFFVTLLFVVSSSTSGCSCNFLLSFSSSRSIKDASVCKHSANICSSSNFVSRLLVGDSFGLHNRVQGAQIPVFTVKTT